ncbi:hypothetical protein ACOV5J_05585 [Weissella soli]|uniref:hypothetical protein n=1 Tax=Weissella soli TaxID=155866 RepID=UPI003C727862
MGSNTVENVDYFFEHDFEMYVALANMKDLIRSPEISDMPRSGSTNNAQLDKLTNIAHASMIVEAVNAVVRSIPAKRGRNVLQWRLEGRTWLQIELISGYSHGWIANKRKEAYEWFALLFDQSYPGLLEPFEINKNG